LSTIRPYPYKRLSRRQVDFSNRLLEKDPGLSFKLGKDSYFLRADADGGGLDAPGAMAATIQVDERIHFELYPEDALLAMTLGDALPVDEFRTLTDEVRGIALEASLEGLLDSIGRFTGGRSTITQVSETPSSEPLSEGIGFRLIRQREGQQSRGVLRANAEGMQWLAARWGRLPGKRRRLLEYIPVPLGIDVGRSELTASQISDLQCLDIILADGAGALHERDIRLWDGHGLTLIGKMVRPDQIKVEKFMNRNKDTMNKPSKPSQKRQAAALATADIPVTLVFEVGEARISMGELQNMQPGYTFQLSEPINMDCPVTIKANGAVIGTGEMVMIDDRLGVQVHDFMHNDQTESES